MRGHSPIGFLKILKILKSGIKDQRNIKRKYLEHVALICLLQAQTEEEDEKGNLVFICEEETQVRKFI